MRLLRRRQVRRGRPATADDLRRLRIGDRLTHARDTWTVRGRMDFDEVGVRWTELVLDVQARVWLTLMDLEDGDDLEVSWWTGIPDSEIEEGGAGGDTVTTAGATYLLQHRGEAAYLASGETGTRRAGTCEYADYRNPDQLLLGYENYGEAWKVSLGRVIAPADVRVGLD